MPPSFIDAPDKMLHFITVGISVLYWIVIVGFGWVSSPCDRTGRPASVAFIAVFFEGGSKMASTVALVGLTKLLYWSTSLSNPLVSCITQPLGLPKKFFLWAAAKAACFP